MRRRQLSGVAASFPSSNGADTMRIQYWGESMPKVDAHHATLLCAHPTRPEAIVALKGGRIARCLLEDTPTVLAPVQTTFPQIGKVVTSRDGEAFALIGGWQRQKTTPVIEFRSWSDLSVLRRFSHIDEEIDDIVLSADGNWIAAVVNGAFVSLLDSVTGKRVKRELGGSDYHVPCFAPHHPLLAISGVSQGGGTLQVFRIGARGQCKLLHTFKSGFLLDDEYPSMTFSADGRWLALLSTRDAGGYDWSAHVTLYNLEDFAIKWAITLDAPSLGTSPWNNASSFHPTALLFHGETELLYGTHHGHLIRIERATGAILQNNPFPEVLPIPALPETSLNPTPGPWDPVSIALQPDGSRVWTVFYNGKIGSLALQPL